MLSESDPTPQLAEAAKQQSRQSRPGRAATGASRKALVMHKEFGAVSSEQRGNAWVRVKRERDPCRGQSTSPEVSGGVNGHDCRTRGYTRSPLSVLFLFVGCLHWRSSPRMPRKLKQETIVSFGWNHHLIRKQTKIWHERGRCEDGRSCMSEDQALFDDCRGCCWFSARLAEGWHWYQGPWIFSGQVNEADSTWHV